MQLVNYFTFLLLISLPTRLNLPLFWRC